MRLRTLALGISIAVAPLLACACGGPDASGGTHADRLSDQGLFAGDLAAQQPAADVLPYAPVAALFSDHAEKLRFLRLPEGSSIGYTDEGPWTFPVGTTLVKTFAYPFDMRAPQDGRRLVETRLLVRRADGWDTHVFVWDESQTEATRVRAGAVVPVAWIDRDGTRMTLDYRVPNENQCLGCHGQPGRIVPLGLRTDQMNRTFEYADGPANQIDRLASLGLFDAPPPPPSERSRLEDPFGSGPLDPRARAYLHANCAHCHNPQAGAADNSGLFLNIETTVPIDYGVCRSPSASGGGTGGLTYDIVPGHPEESILVYRMNSTEPDVKMPELGKLLVDAEGVALIASWIESLAPAGCGGGFGMNESPR